MNDKTLDNLNFNSAFGKLPIRIELSRNLFQLNAKMEINHYKRKLCISLPSGLQAEELDSIFADLIVRTDKAITESVKIATEVGMAASVSKPILDGVRKRARIFETYGERINS